MDFKIDTADALEVGDNELSVLLTNVYVAGGFIEQDEAALLFEPSAVKKRGILIAAREKQHFILAGILIVVPADSPACRLAKNNEAEIHLLGVLPEYRGKGLGRSLIEAAISIARQNAYSKIILWTQVSMKSAQNLYMAVGFNHIDNIVKNDRNFKVFEMAL